jgi:nucleoside-diphosphate-sugar epimerase
LNRNASGTDIFNVNGPDQLTWNQYFQRFNQALGLPPMRQISASNSRMRTMIMDQVATLTSAIKQRYHDRLMEIYLRNGWISRQMKRLKSSIENTPSGTELNQLYCRSAYYSDQHARDTLGYQPQFDLDRGLQMTVSWLQHHEYCQQTDAPSARASA